MAQRSQYALSDIFKDLLNFAATFLRLHGRIVYWLPVVRQEYVVARGCRSSQCSTTCVTNAVVCVILSVGVVTKVNNICLYNIYINHSFILKKDSPPQKGLSFQPVLHDWCSKGCGMCYPVCGTTGVTKAVVCVILSVGRLV